MTKRSTLNTVYGGLNDRHSTKVKEKTDSLIKDNQINTLKEGQVDENGKPISVGKTALSGIMKEFKSKLKTSVT